jgi:cytochrome P450
MIEDARDSKESDPYMLTQLLAALSAGGTYSVANLIVGVLLDLVDNPKFLAEMREEIQVKHAQVDGVWDHAAFNSLLKLDSAMKETARLSPGSNTTYSRVMLKKHTLSNGVCLERGQFICVNSYCRSKDPKIFHDPEKYDALRAYNDDLEEHTARPFKVVHGEDFRWGSGRWACAGRYIAALVAKVILVRLLDEYEFEFSGSDKRPTNMTLHEFVFVNPSVKLRARRREYNSGIAY